MSNLDVRNSASQEIVTFVVLVGWGRGMGGGVGVGNSGKLLLLFLEQRSIGV